MRKIILLAVILVSSMVFGGQKWIEDMFGKELIDSTGKTIQSASLDGKIVGIYFSAHWCPPCRSFTPKLVDFRNKAAEAKENFEIVFVSSDRSEKDMMNYMQSAGMKWTALPFSSQNKYKLSTKFRVRGIPTLIILDPDGKVITTNGRSDVMQHPGNAINIWKNKIGK